MNLDEIQRHINEVMNDRNNREIPEFEGYSPFEMHHILHFTFGSKSPIQLKKLSNSDYNRIPILCQIKYLTNLIAKSEEIKLTKKGYLPTKIVSDLYAQGFLKEKHIELGISKLYKETDSLTIHLTRILAEIAGLIKKRNGKISLTKLAKKILSDNFELLKLILTTFGSKFNWAYCDGYGDNMIGQLGYGFFLILLSKYGNEKRLDTFYANKYFKAFPDLLNSIEPTYGTLESYTANCYSLRTFEIFLYFFGLIDIEKEGFRFESDNYITKTVLFDKLIVCTPHNTAYSQ